jgi:uncharacterized protein (DUF1778 family)
MVSYAYTMLPVMAVTHKSKQRVLDLRRDAVLPNIRVTAEEKALIEKAAKLHHTTVSQFLRHLALLEAEKLEKGKAA